MSALHEAIGRVLLDAREAAKGTPAPWHLADAAMRFAHSEISIGTYRYLKELDYPLRTWPDSLLWGGGLCEARARLMEALMPAFDVPARTVSMFYDYLGGPYSHRVTEVQWGGATHLFDPTNLAWFGKDSILSLEEIDASPKPRTLLNWGGSATPDDPDPFTYLTHKKRVEYHPWVGLYQ